MAVKYNILYVDDESDNLLAFRSVFRRFFNIYTAPGGSEALELLQNQPIDLVLSDQRMPQMTGVELLENIMQNYPEMVRMIVTGFSDLKPIEDAIKDGKIVQYIMKPWDVEELKSIIERALRTVN